MTTTPIEDADRLFRLRDAAYPDSPVDPAEQAALVAKELRRIKKWREKLDERRTDEPR